MAAPVRIAGCQGCGACLLTCPQHAIRPNGAALEVREDLCTACGECIEICPVDAITFAPEGTPNDTLEMSNYGKNSRAKRGD